MYSRASKDLEKIYRYISEELFMPGTAEKQISRIESGILGLEIFPQRGAVRKNGLFVDKGYRQLLVDNYMIIYRINEFKKQVHIVTVQYAKRNI